MAQLITEYQEAVKTTAIYRQGIDDLLNSGYSKETLDAWLGIAYCTGKLNGEAGEIAEEVFKALRDDKALVTTERQDKLFKELGDVCWYIAMLCNELGFHLEDVMNANLGKLIDRQSRGKLKGSGSDR